MSYRVKVREDAPAGAVIANSATIVFDYNDPIDTDPSWWNTVAQVATVSVSIDGVATNLNLIVGQPYGELPVPVKKGYTFDGWYAGDTRITAESIVSGSVTLVAKWTKNEEPVPEPVVWTVVFDANGGVCGEASRAVTNNCAIGVLPVATRDGYTFAGWFAGGVKSTPDYVVTASVTLVAKWEKSGETPLPPEPDPVVWTVVFDANGGVCGEAGRAVTNNCAIGALPAATRDGYTFAGWFAGGVKSTPEDVVTADTTLVAAWSVRELFPEGSTGGSGVSPLAVLAAATVWDGFLWNGDGTAVGTIQVKLAKGKLDKKSGRTTAKATATIQLAGAKKLSVKGVAEVAEDGTVATSATLPDGRALELAFGGRSMTGTFGSYGVEGALNVWMSKLAEDKAVAAAISAAWNGTLNIVGDGAVLAVTVGAKGKTKVTGTSSSGAKVSVAAQMVAGESWSAIPVASPKDASLAFAVWLPNAGGKCEIAGMDGAVIGKPGALRDGMVFATGATDETVRLDWNGKKLSAPKADKLKVVDGAITSVADNGNPIALKVSYTAKTGAFKGSFTLFEVVAGKMKKQAVAFTGVFVDGIGYGTAVLKKLGLSWGVEVR